MKSKKKIKTAVKRPLERSVLRRFTIHAALGNWMVRMCDGNGKGACLIALCTRKPDAHYIAAALNARHASPQNDKLTHG